MDLNPEYDMDSHLQKIEGTLRDACGDGFLYLPTLMATAHSLKNQKEINALISFKNDIVSIYDDFSTQSCGIFQKMNYASVLAPCLREYRKIEKLDQDKTELNNEVSILNQKKADLSNHVSSLTQQKSQCQKGKEELGKDNTELTQQNKDLCDELNISYHAAGLENHPCMERAIAEYDVSTYQLIA